MHELSVIKSHPLNEWLLSVYFDLMKSSDNVFNCFETVYSGIGNLSFMFITFMASFKPKSIQVYLTPLKTYGRTQDENGIHCINNGIFIEIGSKLLFGCEINET